MILIISQFYNNLCALVGKNKGLNAINMHSATTKNIKTTLPAAA